MSDTGFWLLVAATFAAGLAAGIVVAVIYLADREEDVLPYEQAKRCWRRMDGV